MANEDHSQVHHINQRKPNPNQSSQIQKTKQESQENLSPGKRPEAGK